MLALALRPNEAPPPVAAARDVTAREGGVTRIESPPLSRAEADQLLGEELHDERRARLYAETGGNPFYLEQLARRRATPRRMGSRERWSRR